MKRATARASSFSRNQRVMYRMMPGKKPASAIPRMKRRAARWSMSVAAAVTMTTPPADHDTGDPDPCVDPLQDKVAWYFK
jgi:hypothetical protein